MKPAPQELAVLRSKGGFTLPELMMTMGLVSLVALIGIYTHIFGLRMVEITQTRFGTTERSRAALTVLTDEIKSAYRVVVGNGDSDLFAGLPASSPQTGNALQI